jgi:hypothetical protein
MSHPFAAALCRYARFHVQVDLGGGSPRTIAVDADDAAAARAKVAAMGGGTFKKRIIGAMPAGAMAPADDTAEHVPLPEPTPVESESAAPRVPAPPPGLASAGSKPASLRDVAASINAAGRNVQAGAVRVGRKIGRDVIPALRARLTAAFAAKPGSSASSPSPAASPPSVAPTSSPAFETVWKNPGRMHPLAKVIRQKTGAGAARRVLDQQTYRPGAGANPAITQAFRDAPAVNGFRFVPVKNGKGERLILAHHPLVGHAVFGYGELANHLNHAGDAALMDHVAGIAEGRQGNRAPRAKYRRVTRYAAQKPFPHRGSWPTGPGTPSTEAQGRTAEAMHATRAYDAAARNIGGLWMDDYDRHLLNDIAAESFAAPQDALAGDVAATRRNHFVVADRLDQFGDRHAHDADSLALYRRAATAHRVAAIQNPGTPMQAVIAPILMAHYDRGDTTPLHVAADALEDHGHDLADEVRRNLENGNLADAHHSITDVFTRPERFSRRRRLARALAARLGRGRKRPKVRQWTVLDVGTGTIELRKTKSKVAKYSRDEHLALVRATGHGHRAGDETAKLVHADYLNDAGYEALPELIRRSVGNDHPLDSPWHSATTSAPDPANRVLYLQHSRAGMPVSSAMWIVNNHDKRPAVRITPPEVWDEGQNSFHTLGHHMLTTDPDLVRRVVGEADDARDPVARYEFLGHVDRLVKPHEIRPAQMSRRRLARVGSAYPRGVADDAAPTDAEFEAASQPAAKPSLPAPPFAGLTHEVADQWFHPDGTAKTRATTATMIRHTALMYGTSLADAAHLLERAAGTVRAKIGDSTTASIRGALAHLEAKSQARRTYTPDQEDAIDRTLAHARDAANIGPAPDAHDVEDLDAAESARDRANAWLADKPASEPAEAAASRANLRIGRVRERFARVLRYAAAKSARTDILRRVAAGEPDAGRDFLAHLRGAGDPRAAVVAAAPHRLARPRTDFLDALRRTQSSRQDGIREAVHKVATKAGITPVHTTSSLFDSTGDSIPGVSTALFHNGNNVLSSYVGAWYGLLANSPGVGVFHVADDGPDALYRFRVGGSGHEVRSNLDRAGILARHLIPHSQGFDVMVPDPGGKLAGRVAAFTRQSGVPYERSRGTLEAIGGTDPAAARANYRAVVTKFEQGGGGQGGQQQPDEGTPVTNSRRGGGIAQMARAIRYAAGGEPEPEEPETHACEHCGETHDDADSLVTTGGGQPGCESCTETCPRCDDPAHTDDMHDVGNARSRRRWGREPERVCGRCLENDYRPCADCENQFLTDGNWGENSAGDPVCERCSEQYFTCDGCGNTRHNDDYHADGVCDDCAAKNAGSDLIHDYDYSPDDLQFHGDGRHYGVELETVLKHGDVDDAARETLDKLNDGHGDEGFAYLKEDASLKEGVGAFEIVTHPATLDVQKEQWAKVLGPNAPRGLASHDTGCCGLHVHVEREGLSDLTVGKVLSFVNAASNRDFVEKIARRTTDRWARLDPTKKPQDATKKNATRYEAVNLQNDDTIEFRIFKGTLKPESFYRSLEFVDAVVEFARPAESSLRDMIGTDAFFAFVAKNRKQYPHLYPFCEEHAGRPVTEKPRKKARGEAGGGPGRVRMSVRLIYDRPGGGGVKPSPRAGGPGGKMTPTARDKAAAFLARGRDEGTPVTKMARLRAALRRHAANRDGGLKQFARVIRYAGKKKAAEPFYSHAARVIADKVPNAAPADQIRKTLLNAGVKPEEMKWAGIDALLDGADGPVTKADLMHAASGGTPRLHEIVYGGKEYEPQLSRTGWEWSDYGDPDEETGELERHKIHHFYDKGSREEFRAHHDEDAGNVDVEDGDGDWVDVEGLSGDRPNRQDLGSAEMAIEEHLKRKHSEEVEGAEGPSRYHDYALPGGSRYQERLFQLSPAEPASAVMTDHGWDVYDANGQRYGSYPGGEVGTAAEAVETARRRGPTDSNAMYSSSHWDEPNVLFHVRHSDRTGPNKEKLLHLDEIQSDWHQAGRDHGYKSGGDGAAKAQTRLPAVNARLHEIANVATDHARENDVNFQRGRNNPDANATLSYAYRVADQALRALVPFHEAVNHHPTVAATLAPHAEEYERLRAERDALIRQAGPKDAVPDAPFKKTWHELALRKMIDHAARNGYDGITWTPGETHVDRYDLAKQISDVEWHPETHVLRAWPHGGMGGKPIEHAGVTPDRLHEHVGRGLADSLLSQAKDDAANGEVGWVGESPENFKMGGEGMKGFYDRIVPQYLDKHGKKWGAKVGTTEIDAGGTKKAVPHFPITPAMRAEVTTHGQAMFSRRGQTPRRYAAAAPAIAPAALRGRNVADQIHGTRFAYHLRQIERELGTYHPVLRDLARTALSGKARYRDGTNVFARIGEELKRFAEHPAKNGVGLVEGAVEAHDARRARAKQFATGYNWHRAADSLELDAFLHDYITAKLRPEQRDDPRRYLKFLEGYNLSHGQAGTPHKYGLDKQYAAFWSGARRLFADKMKGTNSAVNTRDPRAADHLIQRSLARLAYREGERHTLARAAAAGLRSKRVPPELTPTGATHDAASPGLKTTPWRQAFEPMPAKRPQAVEVGGARTIIDPKEHPNRFRRLASALRRRYSRGSETHSWVAPNGKVFPVEGTHHEWIKRYGLPHIHEAFDKGWVRVTHVGRTLIAHKPGDPPNYKQKAAIADVAMLNGMHEAVHDDDENERTLWSRDDQM